MLPRKYFVRFVQFSQNMKVFTAFKCLRIKFHERNFIVSRHINCRKTNKHKGKQGAMKGNF